MYTSFILGDPGLLKCWQNAIRGLYPSVCCQHDRWSKLKLNAYSHQACFLASLGITDTIFSIDRFLLVVSTFFAAQESSRASLLSGGSYGGERLRLGAAC